MLEPMTYSTQGKHTNHYTTDVVTVIYTKDRKCEKYIKLKYQFELLIPQLSNHLTVFSFKIPHKDKHFLS
jgi:hypothetical protein